MIEHIYENMYIITENGLSRKIYVGLNFPRKFLRNVSTFSYILFVRRILPLSFQLKLIL